MVRYRDGKIVNTKGERFTQVTKAESDEMKKSYVNMPNYNQGYIWQRQGLCNVVICFALTYKLTYVAVFMTILIRILFKALRFNYKEFKEEIYVSLENLLTHLDLENMHLTRFTVNPIRKMNVATAATIDKVLWQEIFVAKYIRFNVKYNN